MNILIVDDQPGMARVTAMACKALGCQPFTAGNTAEATQLLAAEKIDVVLLDVYLGGESGMDYLAELRAQSPRRPVVMFSALNREEIAGEALRRGAFDCLSKPFTLDDLRRQISRIELHLRKNPPQPPVP